MDWSDWKETRRELCMIRKISDIEIIAGRMPRHG
jgi:hypothetical protein